MNLSTYTFTFNLLKPIIRLYFKKRGNKDPRYSLNLDERFLGNYHFDSVATTESKISCVYKTHGTIHIHAASLGEVNLIKSFITEIINLQLTQSINHNFANSPIVITTNTPTGRQAVLNQIPFWQQQIEQYFAQNNTDSQQTNSCIKQYAQDWIQVVYAPLELSKAINNFINYFNPKSTYLVETEIWPLLIDLCHKHHPINIINGRLSDKYYKYYLKNPIRSSLTKIDKIVTQSAFDKFMYVSLFYNLSLAQMHQHWDEFKQLFQSSQTQQTESDNSNITNINTTIDQYFINTFDTKVDLFQKVTIGNNLKYCTNVNVGQVNLQAEIRTQLSLNSDQNGTVDNNNVDNNTDHNNNDQSIKPVLLIASTYPNELDLILTALKKHPVLKFYNLIVAPRHPEDFEIIQQKLQAYAQEVKLFSKFKDSFYSKLNHYTKTLNAYLTSVQTNVQNLSHKNNDSEFDPTQSQLVHLKQELTQIYHLFQNQNDINDINDNHTLNSNNIECTVIDTTGDLNQFYQLAHLCIVGGTFNEVGGHDLLQAIGNKVPIIIGPNFKNQQSVVNDFNQIHALTIIDTDLNLNNRKTYKNLANHLSNDINFTNKLAKILINNIANLDENLQLRDKATVAFNFYLRNQQALTIHLKKLNFFHEKSK